MSKTNTNITVFLDAIGRTILGKVSKETDKTLSIENPAVVHVQANPQTNQLQLQILPIFFREFQADKNQPTVWNFNKTTITRCEDITFAVQFIGQYEQMFRVVETPTPQASTNSDVIKLFDDEESKK